MYWTSTVHTYMHVIVRFTAIEGILETLCTVLFSPANRAWVIIISMPPEVSNFLLETQYIPLMLFIAFDLITLR